MKSFAQEAPDSKAGDILVAAERLFARHGFDGISMNAVAREAGVSKANVFHHFGSKQELYMAVLHHGRQQLTRELTSLVAQPAGDLRECLSRVGRLYMVHFLANADRVRLFMRENLEDRPGQGKALAEKVFGQDYSALTAIIGAARDRGELRPEVDPNVVLALLMASCVFHFQTEKIFRHMKGAEELADPDLFIQRAIDVLLHGVAAR